MAKKATFTCKICGGEHSGLICTAFGGRRGISVLESPIHKAAQRNLNQQALAMLAAPIEVKAEPVNVTNKTRDRPKKLRDAPAPKRRGPKPKGKQAMTAAERQAARRARQKAAK